MDTQFVSEALTKSYAESRERFKASNTGKYASLREFIECGNDCSPLSEKRRKIMAVSIFESTPSVKNRTNEVMWTKALSDTPIEYVMQLARTYHGFAVGIRKRECSFLNGGSICLRRKYNKNMTYY
nr:MAG: hypothetical protein [Hemigrapsus takanoi nimavirus]